MGGQLVVCGGRMLDDVKSDVLKRPEIRTPKIVCVVPFGILKSKTVFEINTRGRTSY
jgi:hypothetical protein